MPITFRRRGRRRRIRRADIRDYRRQYAAYAESAMPIFRQAASDAMPSHFMTYYTKWLDAI